MTMPPTDRLREILQHYFTKYEWDGQSWIHPFEQNLSFEQNLRALIADERKDARRQERERCAKMFRHYCPDLTEAGALKLLGQLLPDEEPA